jgi:hypothetical protein
VKQREKNLRIRAVGGRLHSRTSSQNMRNKPKGRYSTTSYF